MSEAPISEAPINTARFRCSLGAREEQLAGSAAEDTAYLLVEHPGPWGNKALAESRLPESVRTGLAQAAAEAGVRVQLIRRHGRRTPTDHFRVFLGYAAPGDSWLETALLDVPEDLLDLDLDGLAEGRRSGFEEYDGRLLLVCTNGRRDACCAEFGRPVTSILATRFPQETWETTHLGGHRFAATVLTLPEGLSYGWLDVDSALQVSELTLDGRLDAARLRGRTAYAPAVQAAEIALLESLGEDRIDGLELVEVVPDVDAGVEDAATRVIFRHGAVVRRVEVHVEPGPTVQTSCGSSKVKATNSYRVTVLAP